MLIVTPHVRRQGTPRRHRRLRALGLLVYSGLMVGIGAKLYQDGFFAARIMPYARSMTVWPRNTIASWSAKPRKLTVDIKFEDWMKLAHQREIALDAGVLFSDGQEFVPAKLHLDGDKIDAKMRLKGDGVNHLVGEKWSFRVRTRGNDTFMGMTQFSMHQPETRNWMFEWLGQRLMRAEDVVALRYELVDVTINGKHLGIYAIEEHFEKRLVENNRRREGPLIRFNEDLMWHEIADQIRPFPDAEKSGTGDYLVAEAEGFQTSRILANPAMKELYLKGLGLLDAFRRGELTTSAAFDVPLLAKYFTLVDLLGAEHGSRWHNIRFYFNPVTSKLEPVSFDLFGGTPTKALSISGISTTSAHNPLATHEAEFHHQLFADDVFTRAYLGELERVSKTEYLDAALAKLDDELQAALAVLYTEFPYYELRLDVLRRNQRYIESCIHPQQALHARLRAVEGGTLRIQLANAQALPLEVVGVERSTGEAYKPSAEPVLRPRRAGRPVDFVESRFSGPAEPESPPVGVEASYTLLYRVMGSNELRRAVVAPYDLPDLESRSADLLRKPSNIEQFRFLLVDESAKTIRIKSGTWEVKEDLVFPAGYTILAGPGTEIDLTQSATILSRSPLRWLGEEGSPVILRSSDHAGQGLTVLQAGGMSELHYVRFDGFSNPARPGWKLTGAVTFYESPLTVTHGVFENNVSEDSLNTIRTTLHMSDSTFVGTQRDAFDADFCDVVMTDVRFVNIGNDGLDVSGSTVRLENVTVDGAKDKGLSIGEHSRATGKNLVVRGARIGLASKDLSEFQVNGARIEDCAFGSTVLQKKPEYGGGTLHLRRLTMTDVGQLYLVEKGSTLTVDGAVIATTTDDAKVIVYGAESPFPIGKFVQ